MNMMCKHRSVLQRMLGHQDSTGVYSLFHLTWVSGVTLRSLGLHSSCFTHRAIPSPSDFFVGLTLPDPSQLC